jgi:hypothetical protein
MRRIVDAMGAIWEEKTKSPPPQCLINVVMNKIDMTLIVTSTSSGTIMSQWGSRKGK